MHFIEIFGRVFEHAPWVAERVAGLRPFADRRALHRAMGDVVASADRARKLALIQGHPELAGKAAIDRSLTAESAAEQGGAGLDRLTAEEYERFHRLNGAYRARFGFPFILAVRGLDKHAILAAFERRVGADEAAEFDEALRQIARITEFRLGDLVADS
ncbi:MAG: 2-oxo-4-hydroxy-4-carboxy-5-ureidoimidazoline decarboxylase [Rhodospirillales bacterium]|nr:2-oxo-4-hydroxy-4-carboxy-5-ureidoimidazoline decarboxylase [Rhodospirillales bacterium]